MLYGPADHPIGISCDTLYRIVTMNITRMINGCCNFKGKWAGLGQLDKLFIEDRLGYVSLFIVYFTPTYRLLLRAFQIGKEARITLFMTFRDLTSGPISGVK